MYGALRIGARRRTLARHRTPEMVARLLAVSALLLATCIVLAVLIEAGEPNPSTAVPHIQPLPQNLFSP